MRRTLAIVASSLSLAGVTVLGFTPPAQAADYHGCKKGKFCLYEKNAYGGLKASLTKNDKNLADTLFDGSPNRTVNDKASSMINRTSRDVVLYRDRNYHGTTYLALAGSRDSDFNRGQTFNDQASSVKFR